MGLVALRCPNCGGEIQMDSSLASGFCTYCGSKVVNENAIVGKVTLNRSDELVNSLKLAKAALIDGDRPACQSYINTALVIEPESSDAWFMKAVLDSEDKRQYQVDRARGVRGKVQSGVFTEKDLDRYWNPDRKNSRENHNVLFIVGLFFILFFGFALSVVDIIIWQTFIPLIVTVVLLVLLIAVHYFFKNRLDKMP